MPRPVGSGVQSAAERERRAALVDLHSCGCRVGVSTGFRPAWQGRYGRCQCCRKTGWIVHLPFGSGWTWHCADCMHDSVPGNSKKKK